VSKTTGADWRRNLARQSRLPLKGKRTGAFGAPVSFPYRRRLAQPADTGARLGVEISDIR
jgi:hypothetical protein